MYSILLVLTLDNDKNIIIEMEKNVSKEYVREKIKSTNKVEYQGQEKVVSAYLASIPSRNYLEKFVPLKNIEIREE